MGDEKSQKDGRVFVGQIRRVIRVDGRLAYDVLGKSHSTGTVIDVMFDLADIYSLPSDPRELIRPFHLWI